MRRRAGLVVAAALAAACSRVRHVPSEEGKKPAPEAPDDASAKGVPPRGVHPRVPAALLAEGAVGRIQRALAARGLLQGHREGELDTPTSAALRKFQRDEGLAATGFPDRETVRRLGIEPEEAYGREREKGR